MNAPVPDPALSTPATTLTAAELADAQPRTADQKSCSNPTCPLRYAHRGPCAPEVTTAVQRGGRAIWEHDNGHTTWPPRDPLEIGPAEDAARAALAAALDSPELEDLVVETLASAGDRSWALSDGPKLARRIRGAILGTDQ